MSKVAASPDGTAVPQFDSWHQDGVDRDLSSLACRRATFLLALALGACGGGGGGDAGGGNTGDLNLNIAPSAQVNVTSSYALQITSLYVNRPALKNDPSKFTNATSYGDIDGDGDADVFMAPGGIQADGTGANGIPTPFEIHLNDGAGNFTPSTAYWGATTPTAIWPRKTLVADFNGDGRPDFCVIDSGWDYPPFPGAAPVVLLSSTSGPYTVAPGLDTLVGYHHGGAAADIDSDGDIDIFITSGGANPGTSPFFLINDGAGNFTQNTDRLPPELDPLRTGFSVGPMFSAELIDVDGDGYVDLIVGGVEPPAGSLPLTIYWGDSTGTYRHDRRTELPSVAGYPDHLDIDAEDLDGDGDRDLVITRTSHDYAGYALQALEQRPGRIFVDVTSAWIDAPASNPAPWIDWIRLQDFDGDGNPDIVVDDASRNLKWLYNPATRRFTQP